MVHRRTAGPLAVRALLPALLLALALAGCSGGTAPDGRSGGTAAFDEGFTHHTAEVNGTTLHYVIGGQGEEAVVLLHGFPETWYAWRGVMPALAEQYTVISPDLRGVGESSLEESGYDKETLAGDVHGLVRQLGFEEAAVAGHDMGAMTAYAYAREYREETSHLVFMSAALPGFGLEELLDFREEGQGLPHLVFHAQSSTPSLLEGQEKEYVEGFLGGDPEDEATAEYARAYSRPGRLEAGLKQYQALYTDARDNRAKAEPKLQMPVLALGGGSPEMPLGSMQQVAGDVTGDAVPGAGHYLHETHPEETAERLLAFFDGQR